MMQLEAESAHQEPPQWPGTTTVTGQRGLKGGGVTERPSIDVTRDAKSLNEL